MLDDICELSNELCFFVTAMVLPRATIVFGLLLVPLFSIEEFVISLVPSGVF